MIIGIIRYPIKNKYFEGVFKNLFCFSNRNKSDFIETNNAAISNNTSFVFMVLSMLKRIKNSVAIANGGIGFKDTNLENSTTENSNKIPKSNKKLNWENNVAEIKSSTYTDPEIALVIVVFIL